jgi:hypothetical protein
LVADGKWIQPSTSGGKHIKCEYFVMIELAIPWAPDLEIYSPVVLYAPQNAVWANWQPPAWIATAVPQQVDARLAVPQGYVMDVHPNNVMLTPQEVHVQMQI